MSLFSQFAKSIARQALTTAGAALVTAGVVSPGASHAEMLIGGAIAIISYAWTVTHNVNNVIVPITSLSNGSKNGV